MTIEFKLPELGENIEAGDVVSVLVSVGDEIEADQPVLELETDKATVEVPSSVKGVIKEISVQEGDTIEVGQVVLTVEDGGQPETASEPEAEAPAATEQPSAEKKEEPAAEAKPVEAKETPAPAKTAREVKLPELGENIESGEIVSVLVSVGDEIEVDQPVLELETDKATVEVPAPAGGVVKEVHVQEGDSLEIGQLILTVAGAEAGEPEAAPEPEPETRKAETKQAEEPEEAKEEKPAPEKTDTQPRPARSGVPAAPNVRRIAREIGVDITQVNGSGPEGRITMEDVKRAARERTTVEAAPAPAGDVPSRSLPDFSKWGEIRRESMSNVRRTTAEHLSRAWTAPHVTQFDKADVQELEDLRQRFAPKAEAAGGKLTVTAILIKVVAAALKAFPQFNASVDMENREIIYKDYYHIGIAVDTDRGLLVPVIRDVDRKNIIELSVELTEVAEKARNRKLGLEEMQGGNFSVTNLGGIGGTNFTPVVNWPEVAILGLARARVEPVYRNDQFEPRLMLPLALSYDHRLIDGADGIRFLRWIVQALEDPVSMSLQAW